MLIRLNKYLADSGIASRRKSDEFIFQGRVTVNDKTVIDPALRINDEKDIVMVDNEKINPKRHIYLLLNKPKGVVTTTDDEKKRRTVLDLIKTRERIYPVGRLDYNTTGVLLLTNDGNFSNLLTHPRNKVPKEYEVKLEKPLSDADSNKLLKGITLDDRRSMFTKIISDSTKKNITVTAIEGRNHFVKRMFGVLGYTVLKLNRKKFAGLKADIPLGGYRKLTKHEIEKLFTQYAR